MKSVCVCFGHHSTESESIHRGDKMLNCSAAVDITINRIVIANIFEKQFLFLLQTI